MAERLTVLLVSNDPDLGRRLGQAVEAVGARLQVERNGESALRTVVNRRVDAIFVDFLLISLGAEQPIPALRAQLAGRPVPIFLLGGAHHGPERRGEVIRRYRVEGVLERPFDGQSVVRLLETTVAGGRGGEGGDGSVGCEPPSPAASMAAGNLAQLSFPRILAAIGVRAGGGGLFLRRSSVRKVVYFKAGEPVQVKSNLLSECLGRMLVREQAITAAQCEESLLLMRATRRRQGLVLVEMKALLPGDLAAALERQLRLKLFDIFSWPEGVYHYRTDIELPPYLCTLSIASTALLLAGLRQAYSGERLESSLAPYLARFPGSTGSEVGGPPALALSAAELGWLELLDGTRSTAELVAAAAALGISHAEARSLLYALLCAGAIRMEEAACAAPPIVGSH